MPDPTASTRADEHRSRWYDIASSVMGEVAACGCETVPLHRYALCPRCACLVTIARALRERATKPPMPEAPGATAYAAYSRLDPHTFSAAWCDLEPYEQAAWEAAAQAVRAMQEEDICP